MKLGKRFKACQEDIEKHPHSYCVINNSPKLESPDLRVQTNIFGENPAIGKFPIFYP